MTSTRYKPLTVAEVFPPKFRPMVKEEGECWLWRGSMKKSRRNGVLPLAEGKSARNFAYTRVYGRQEGVLRLIPVCETPECVHPEHLDSSFSDAGRLLFIKQHTRPEGDCLIWTGTVVDGRPRMELETYVRGKRVRHVMSIHKFIYTQEHGLKYTPFGTITLSCGNIMCVNHKHIRYHLRPADGLCEAGHRLPTNNTFHCPECRKQKETTRCPRGHEDTHEVPTKNGKMCSECRDEDVRAFIAERNATAFKRGEL